MDMKFRRVVTGHNEKGKSCVKWDAEISPLPLRPGPATSHVATRTLPRGSPKKTLTPGRSEPAWRGVRFSFLPV